MTDTAKSDLREIALGIWEVSGDANAGNKAANVTPEEGEVVGPQQCIHTIEFMTQPGVEAVIEQQRNEMMANAMIATQAQEDANAQALAEYEAALAAQQAAANDGG